MSEIRFLCVHFRDSERVARFARHIAGLPLPGGWSAHGAICDNSGDWPEGVELPGGWSLVRPGKNVGYLPGCAAANQLFDGATAEWTAIVNTDLVFEPTFLMRLARTPLPENVVAVGPDLRLRSGRQQNPFFSQRPPRRRLELYRYLFGSRWRSQLMERVYALRRRRTIAEPPPSPAPFLDAYALHGAATFLSRRYFEQRGTLNHPGFMYGEEIFLAEEVREMGGRCVWLPDSVVWHDAGATTGSPAQAADRARWQHESMTFLLKQYF